MPKLSSDVHHIEHMGKQPATQGLNINPADRSDKTQFRGPTDRIEIKLSSAIQHNTLDVSPVLRLYNNQSSGGWVL